MVTTYAPIATEKRCEYRRSAGFCRLNEKPVAVVQFIDFSFPFRTGRPQSASFSMSSRLYIIIIVMSSTLYKLVWDNRQPARSAYNSNRIWKTECGCGFAAVSSGEERVCSPGAAAAFKLESNTRGPIETEEGSRSNDLKLELMTTRIELLLRVTKPGNPDMSVNRFQLPC